MKNKMKRNGGFTLVEMLIVVAIIAILVAVSIPLVSSSLDSAKQATDDANVRAAKAEATIAYLDYTAGSDASISAGTGVALTAGDNTAYYDAVNGKLVSASSGLDYGKVTGHQYIVVTINTSSGDIQVKWNNE